jgi:CheY-like chemotaxis protein
VRETRVILLVEDREDDVFLVRKAFEKAYIINPLQVVRDGHEAVAYLKGEGSYANRIEYPLPSLVLLDLKLPGMDGFEVLQWIRQEPSLRSLPVVVLTSSDQIRDVNAAYQLGANSFLVKPLDFQNFIDLSKAIERYWINFSKIPESVRPEKSSDPKEKK